MNRNYQKQLFKFHSKQQNEMSATVQD